MLERFSLTWSKVSRMPRIVFAVLFACFAVGASAQGARVSFAAPVSLFGYASGVAIEWEVYDDAEVDYYVVLRRASGTDRAIATVPPERDRADASTKYRYIDARTPAPGTLFRLRAVFSDESFADSDWLDAGRASASRTRLLGALDEESLARLHLRLTSPAEREVTVRIKSISGTELDSYAEALAAGDNVLEIDYARWPSGMYTVEVDDEVGPAEWLVRVDAEQQRARTRRLASRD